MAKKTFETLSETMFYVLMAFQKGEMYGTEVADWVLKKTAGRIKLGPGTLYTILSKFLDEQVICETGLDGRKRSYQITDKGAGLYQAELSRLRQCVKDAEGEEYDDGEG